MLVVIAATIRALSISSIVCMYSRPWTPLRNQAKAFRAGLGLSFIHRCATKEYPPCHQNDLSVLVPAHHSHPCSSGLLNKGTIYIYLHPPLWGVRWLPSCSLQQVCSLFRSRRPTHFPFPFTSPDNTCCRKCNRESRKLSRKNTDSVMLVELELCSKLLCIVHDLQRIMVTSSSCSRVHLSSRRRNQFSLDFLNTSSAGIDQCSLMAH